MIHVSVSRGDTLADHVLHFSLRSTTTIQEFHALLDRSLNCLPPERHAEWVTLSDRLYEFLHSVNQSSRKE